MSAGTGSCTYVNEGAIAVAGRGTLQVWVRVLCCLRIQARLHARMGAQVRMPAFVEA